MIHSVKEECLESGMKSRKSNKIQIIDLYFLRRNIEQWESQPNCFWSFLRFNESYKKDIESANEKIHKYEDMGCSFLSEEIKSYVLFLEESNAMYYGFHSIGIAASAIILAKMLHYKINKNKILNDINSFGQGQEQSVEYEPRVYPLHHFLEIASESTKKTVKTLERFPEDNYNSIFDNFCIVVPGFKVFSGEREYYFIGKNGERNSYNSVEEASKALDLFLIGNNYMSAVILGEKDEKCYFINYF